MPSKHDADAWDRQAAYHYVRRMIVAHQAKERPTDALVAERLTIRKCCCDSGPLSVERYETALAALEEPNVLAFLDIDRITIRIRLPVDRPFVSAPTHMSTRER